MRAAILFAPLLAALSAMAAPASEGTLLARQDGGKTLRIIFSEKYCVVPTGTSPRTGCPVDEQQVGSPVVGQDWTATIEGHEVSIVHLTCNLYTCEDVYIDGVKKGDRILFGPGVTYGYDFPL